MSARIEVFQLARGAGGRLAFDAAVDKPSYATIDSKDFDSVHNHCVSVLQSLAKAGHSRSHQLLNPLNVPAAHDSATGAVSEAVRREVIGPIGL